uniref:Uncharacterized protein n=2 Tax=Ditylum brightwellii TaxID=49249 RepID=A0A7S4TBP3_9STRA
MIAIKITTLTFISMSLYCDSIALMPRFGRPFQTASSPQTPAIISAESGTAGRLHAYSKQQISSNEERKESNSFKIDTSAFGVDEDFVASCRRTTRDIVYEQSLRRIR